MVREEAPWYINEVVPSLCAMFKIADHIRNCVGTASVSVGVLIRIVSKRYTVMLNFPCPRWVVKRETLGKAAVCPEQNITLLGRPLWGIRLTLYHSPKVWGVNILLVGGGGDAQRSLNVPMKVRDGVPKSCHNMMIYVVFLSVDTGHRGVHSVEVSRHVVLYHADCRALHP